jgi:hypothetical protein
MTMTRSRLAMLLLVGGLLLPGGAAAAGADDLTACLRAPLADDLAAKVAFQDGMRDLTATDRPALAGLATLNRDLQVALAEARAVRLDWLAAEDPERLRPLSDAGAPWRSFAWDRGDERALRKADPRYTTIAVRAAALAERSDGHPDWPAVRDYLRTDLRGDDRFLALVRDARGSAATTDAALRACFDAADR